MRSGGSFLSECLPDFSAHSLYGNMIKQARKASAYGRIRGLLWYQGESECGNRDNVVLYTQRMHAIFSAIRQDLGIPDLPIIFVQLGPNPHEPGFEYWHDLQVKQQSIADSEPPWIDMVTAEDLHAISPANPHHLDQPSQIILGGRMADAMYQIMP